MADRFSFAQIGCNFYNPRYIKGISCNNETGDCQMTVANTQSESFGQNHDQTVHFNLNAPNRCTNINNETLWSVLRRQSDGTGGAH